jgi:hypothetical protein
MGSQRMDFASRDFGYDFPLATRETRMLGRFAVYSLLQARPVVGRAS